MSTHCRIGVETGQGIPSISCHFDGYPTGAGVVLDEHWHSPEKLLALLASGDIEHLANDVASCGRVENPAAAVVSSDQAAFREAIDESGATYGYLFTPEGWSGMQRGFDYERDGRRRQRADSDWMPVVELVALGKSGR